MADSDGIFYTMDDNIINVNILNLFDNKTLIYYNKELQTLDNYSEWWWDDDKYGKVAINKLLDDPEFSKYNITKFCASFSDWFYLPKQYLTDDLFDLFELFAKYWAGQNSRLGIRTHQTSTQGINEHRRR